MLWCVPIADVDILVLFLKCGVEFGTELVTVFVIRLYAKIYSVKSA